MSEKANPKLIVGCLEVVGADGESAIPFDEAVIHIEGDEDAEIRVLCAGALRLAPLIVKPCNAWGDIGMLRARIAELELKR